MEVYRIADLNIGIKTRFDFTKKYISEYLINDAEPQFTVCVTDEQIEYEKSVTPERISEPYYELTAILRVICNTILQQYNGFFFHCSCFEFDGNAYIFTAKSGTGKSTHTRLWREVYGDKITMINDDKPIVRLIDGKFYIYGTPWNGKHSISTNMKSPVKALFYLHQAKENKVVKTDQLSAMSKLLSQTILPDSKITMNILLDMIEKFVTDIPVFDLYCDISHDAVSTVYNVIKEL